MRTEMREFLDIERGTDRADSTINQYRKGLELFSDWLDSEGLDTAEVDARDLKRYLSWLKSERDYASKTIRLKFVAVSRFYADFAEQNEGFTDPTDDVKLADYAPKQTRKEEITKERRVWLSKEEVEQLVQHVPTPRLRNRLVVLFQYFTGLRRQEVSDVKLDDIDREQRQVQVRGKGGKTHTAFWQPKMDGLLTAWLDGGERAASPYARDSEYLFVTQSSPQLSGSRLNDIVKEAAENAGIQEVLYKDRSGSRHFKVTSHTLRHSFAMHFLQNGGSKADLSKLLAHESVTTTEIYGDILDERSKDAYNQHAPSIDF